MREAWPAGVQLPFKLVMTDFTQNNVDFWLNHEPLKTHVESGMLDMAVFDAIHDRSIRLIHSKQTLNASSLANPVVVINNYIFDTLPHDAFFVEHGKLSQANATVATSTATAAARKQLAAAKQQHGGVAPPGKIPIEAGMIKTLNCSWDYSDVSLDSLPAPYSTDPALLHTLQWYVDNCDEASVLLPLGGMSLINNVLAFSSGRAMVLVGDKAYSKLSELAGRRDPHVAVHGSFSLMVNLHAVQKYTECRQGISMLTPYIDGFKCAAFVFGMETDVAMETQIAWEDVMTAFGPENFSAIQRCVRDETQDPSLATALSVIRAAQWDSDVFYKFKGTVLAKSTAAPDKVKADLYRDVQRILQTYYPLQASKDISFELARVLMGLGRYDESVELFHRSTAECGEHHVTWYNVGLCEYHRGNFKKACELFTLSLEQSGGKYDNARSWLAKAEAMQQQTAGGSGAQSVANPTTEN